MQKKILKLILTSLLFLFVAVPVYALPDGLLNGVVLTGGASLGNAYESNTVWVDNNFGTSQRIGSIGSEYDTVWYTFGTPQTVGSFAHSGYSATDVNNGLILNLYDSLGNIIYTSAGFGTLGIPADTLQTVTLDTPVANVKSMSVTYVFNRYSVYLTEFDLFAPAPTISSETQDVTVSALIEPTINITINNSSVDFGTINLTNAETEISSALIATVSSNSTFKLEVSASGDYTGLNGNTMSIGHLKVKASSVPTYLTMVTTPVLLLDAQPPVAMQSIPIDMKLITDWLIKPDTYSTTINFVATQI